MKTMKFTQSNIALISDGQKTQTRRPVKPQPTGWCVDGPPDQIAGGVWAFRSVALDGECQMRECSYQIGDLCRVADPDNEPTQPAIVIEITGVRCERLHEIREADAIAEGCGAPITSLGEFVALLTASSATDRFIALWSTIYGEGHQFAWSRHLWVFVYDFKKVTI